MSKPKNIENIKNVVVVENYIDGLSYIELKGLNTSETAIISTQGTLSEKELETIKEYLHIVQSKGAELDKIVLAFDNDEAGIRYEDKVKEYFENVEYKDKFYVDSPNLTYKDWNEQLIDKKLEFFAENDLISVLQDEELRGKAERIKEKRERKKQKRNSGYHFHL